MKLKLFKLKKKELTVSGNFNDYSATSDNVVEGINSQKLEVFSVPGTRSFWFKFISQYIGTVKLSVYNYNGESIFIDYDRKNKVEINRLIDVNLNKEIYMLQIHYSNRTISKQIIIQ